MRVKSYEYDEGEEGHSSWPVADTADGQKVDGDSEFHDARPSTDDETARLMSG